MRESRVQRLEPLGRVEQQGGASRPRVAANVICACSSCARACASSSSGPDRATASSRSASSGAPAWCLPCAAASARRARRSGSGVSSAARSWNAAPAARPPRARARPAERSSSAATSSSSPPVAWARCHARRSGSTPASVASARASWTRRCSSGAAARYTADRTSGWRKRTWAPSSTRPAAVAGPAAPPSIPSAPAAFHTSSGSPTGSAAATRSRSRVAGGSSARRSWKRSSMRPASAGAPSSPSPPASWAGVRPRGSSSSASGLPRVSATIRSRTRSSSGPATTAVSSARASWSSRPPTTSSASPSRCRSPAGSRTARTNPTDSAPRRRATKASACAEAPSSHCASSTTQTSGRSSATSDSRLRTARPTRNRSGASPSRTPNAVPKASRCGPGKPLQAIHERRAELMQPGERELHLRLDARRPRDAAAGRAAHEVVEQRALADAGLAAQQQRPARTRAHARHELIQRSALTAPAEQHLPGIRRRHGHAPRLRMPRHVGNHHDPGSRSQPDVRASRR